MGNKEVALSDDSHGVLLPLDGIAFWLNLKSIRGGVVLEIEGAWRSYRLRPLFCQQQAGPKK